MSTTQDDHNVSSQNSEFWDELCGTKMASELGIADDSASELKRFDDNFFSFYPYLWPFLSSANIENKTVLEIGLGYGTVGTKLTEAGANHIGLDIAPGPARMMAHRHSLQERHPQAIRSSALRLPFQSNSLDIVVSIGCLHHTGDFHAAVAEVFRVLKPRGKALIMIYYRYSYEQWLLRPLKTSRWALAELGLASPPAPDASMDSRYDHNSEGEAPPSTEYFSKREVRRAFHSFRAVTMNATNCHNHGILRKIGLSRDRLLPWMGLAGLDLYVDATK